MERTQTAVERDAVETGLVFPKVTVRGTIYPDPGRSRFSDAWNALLREARAFLPVTDAAVTAHGADSPSAKESMMLVEKARVVLVYPLDADAVGRGHAGRLERDPVDVVMLTEGLRIEGTVYADPRRTCRFSDAWDEVLSAPRLFTAVTGCRTSTPDGRPVADASFAGVQAAKIVAAWPAGAEDYRPAFKRDDLTRCEMSVNVGGYRIEGTFHLEPTVPGFHRLSDAWDNLARDRRRFVPVTSASVAPLEHPGASETVEVLVVEKGRIDTAFPL